MSLDESKFHLLADRMLGHLTTVIDRDLGERLDVDVEGDVLSIVLPGGGQYIVNKNDVLRQLWLSSPVSGAWHFGWDAKTEAWLSTRHDHVELGALLAGELEGVTGTRVAL